MTDLTRSQRNLIQAHAHVSEIAARYPLEDESDPALTAEERTAVKKRNEPLVRHRKNYGNLCHSFPVLAHRSGLIQAISFYEAKGAGDGPSKLAYQQLLPHIAELLEPRANNAPHGAGLARRMAKLPVEDYMVKTRRLLEAWNFYKQFAESILNVAAGDQGEDE